MHAVLPSWRRRFVSPAPRRSSGSQAPSIEETTHGEVPITVLRPGTGLHGPSLVFVNGATPDGRKHPIVRRLGLGLARAGFLVFVPELPASGEGSSHPRHCDRRSSW
jgi:hypothetical protein